MKLQRRNTVLFQYKPVTGQEERLLNGMHTGNYDPVYGDPVMYRGNISVPSGFATDNLFGVNTQYTHVLVMDKPDADIAESGLIEWNGDKYDVEAVRKSINVLSVALKKRTANHAADGE